MSPQAIGLLIGLGMGGALGMSFTCVLVKLGILKNTPPKRKDLITEGKVCKGGVNDPPTTPPPSNPPHGTIPHPKCNDFLDDARVSHNICSRCHQPFFGDRGRDLCRVCNNKAIDENIARQQFFDVNLYCPFCGHIQKNVKSNHVIPICSMCPKCQRIFDVRPATEEEKNPPKTNKELYDAAIKALHELADVHFSDNIKSGQCFIRCPKCAHTWETDISTWTSAMCPKCNHMFGNNSNTSIVPKPPPLRHIRESDDKPVPPEKISHRVVCQKCSHCFLIEYMPDKVPEKITCPECSTGFESQLFHPVKPVPPENVVLREDQDLSDIKPKE
jgi:hypothetical protein